jgi:hypothetical protein
LGASFGFFYLDTSVEEPVIKSRKMWNLKQLMLVSKGEISNACRQSGLSQSRLYALLKQRDVKCG